MTSLTTDQAHAVDQAAATRRKRRRPRRWPLVGIVLAVAAVAVFIATRGKPHSYVLGSVRAGVIQETVAVSGALQPTRSWSLYFTTSGTVATVLVSPGEHVTRGQALATLNSESLSLQVSSAQAAVTADGAKLSADEAKLSADQAKLDGDQAKLDTHHAESGAQSTADAALITAGQDAVTADQSALAADQDARTAAVQQLSIARANLTAATLRAPAAATVGQVNITAGQNVGGGGGQSGSAGASSSSESSQASGSSSTISAGTGGSAAAILLENGSLQALGQVPDSQIAQVRVGQRALITPAGQANPIGGRLQAITPTPTTSGGVTIYPVKIGWSRSEKGLFDGMSAQISIIVAKASGLTVPSSAVHTSGTRSWVMVVHGARVRNGRARGGQEVQQAVAVGPSGGGLTLVRSGLHAGEQVVLADNATPLPSSSSSLQKGSGKSQLRKLLG